MSLFHLSESEMYSYCFIRRNPWSWYFKREERIATLVERHDDTGSSGHFFHHQLVLAENIFLLLLSACRASAPERLQWIRLGTSLLCGFASMNQHFLKDVLHCAHLHDYRHSGGREGARRVSCKSSQHLPPEQPLGCFTPKRALKVKWRTYCWCSFSETSIEVSRHKINFNSPVFSILKHWMSIQVCYIVLLASHWILNSFKSLQWLYSFSVMLPFILHSCNFLP